MPLAPTYTAQLLRPLHDLLIDVLRGLEPDEWELPTVARGWSVRDVAAHLLDGDLRRLSMQRDRHVVPPPHPIAEYAGLVRFINGLNAEWVAAARRFSPRVLVELLEYSGPATASLLASLPPHGPAHFAVAWAGEARSEHWMDTGREYAERWHHQMQIRDAVRRRHPLAPDVLLERRWMLPLLDISMRALPHAYRETSAEDGTAVVVAVDVDGSSPWRAAWSLIYRGGAWELEGEAVERPRVRVRLDGESAWRLFYNAPQLVSAGGYPVVDGERDLAEPLLAARSVMV